MSFLNKIFGVKAELPLKDKRVYLFGIHDHDLVGPIITKLGGQLVPNIAGCLSDPKKSILFANNINEVPERYRQLGVYNVKYLLDARTKPQTSLKKYVIAKKSEAVKPKPRNVVKQSAVAAAAGVETPPTKRKNTEDLEENEKPERKRRNPKPFTSEEDDLILDMIRKRPDLRMSKSYYNTISEAMGMTHPGSSIRTRFRYHLAKEVDWVYEVDATGIIKKDTKGDPIKLHVGDSFAETKTNFTADEDLALSKAMLANGGEATPEVFEMLARTNRAHKADQWRNRWKSKVEPYGAKKFIAFYNYAIRSQLVPYPLGPMSSSNKSRRKRLHPNDFNPVDGEHQETTDEEEDESMEEIDDELDAPDPEEPAAKPVERESEPVEPAESVEPVEPLKPLERLAETHSFCELTGSIPSLSSHSQSGPQVGASQPDEPEEESPMPLKTQHTEPEAPISRAVLEKLSPIESYNKKVRACIEYLDGNEEEIFDEFEGRLGMNREWAKRVFRACSGDPDPFCQVIAHVTLIGGEPTTVRGFFSMEEDNDLLLERNLDKLRDKHSEHHLNQRKKFLDELKRRNYRVT